MSDYFKSETDLNRYIYKVSSRDNDARSSRWPMHDEEEKYYEVQVYVDKTDEAVQENRIDQILNMNKYVCPVCNVTVPKSYMKEHNKSFKHITCLGISKMAMDRVQEYMSLEIVESKKIEVDNTYFCDPCACVVLKSDKDHEKSEIHEISVQHDEGLKELLEIYLDRDNVKLKKNRKSDITMYKPKGTFKYSIDDGIQEIESDDNCDDDFKNGDKKKFDVKSKIYFDDEDSDQTDQNTTKTNNETHDDRNSVPQDLDTKQSEIAKEDTIRSLKVTADNLEDYLSALEERYDKPTHSLFALPKGLVKIVAINGDVFKVRLYNFLGYNSIKKNIYCRVCAQAGIQDNGDHEWSPEHMNKVMTPIHDKHGLRQIDDVWFHCLLCNELVKNTELHIKSNMHSNNLKKSINIKLKLQPKSTIVKENTEDEINIVDVTHDTCNSDSACAICNEALIELFSMGALSPKDNQVVPDHNKHFAAFLDANKINEMSDILLHCALCKVTILNKSVHSHCLEKIHKRRLRKFNRKKSSDELADKPSTVLIATSQCSQNSKKDISSPSNDNYDTQINGTDHNKNFASLIDTNQINEINYNLLHCAMCKVNILKNLVHTHCLERTHRRKLKKFNKKKSSNDTADNTSSVVTPTAQSTQISKKEEVTSQSIGPCLMELHPTSNERAQVMPERPQQYIGIPASSTPYPLYPRSNERPQVMPERPQQYLGPSAYSTQYPLDPRFNQRPQVMPERPQQYLGPSAYSTQYPLDPRFNERPQVMPERPQQYPGPTGFSTQYPLDPRFNERPQVMPERPQQYPAVPAFSMQYTLDPQFNGRPQVMPQRPQQYLGPPAFSTHYPLDPRFNERQQVMPERPQQYLGPPAFSMQYSLHPQSNESPQFIRERSQQKCSPPFSMEYSLDPRSNEKPQVIQTNIPNQYLGPRPCQTEYSLHPRSNERQDTPERPALNQMIPVLQNSLMSPHTNINVTQTQFVAPYFHIPRQLSPENQILQPSAGLKTLTMAGTSNAIKLTTTENKEETHIIWLDTKLTNPRASIQEVPSPNKSGSPQNIAESKLTKETECVVPLSKSKAKNDSAVKKLCKIDAVDDIIKKQNSFKRLLQTNCLREIYFNVYYCEACAVSDISLWTLPDHCVGSQHREMLKRKAGPIQLSINTLEAEESKIAWSDTELPKSRLASIQNMSVRNKSDSETCQLL